MFADGDVNPSAWSGVNTPWNRGVTAMTALDDRNDAATGRPTVPPADAVPLCSGAAPIGTTERLRSRTMIPDCARRAA
jgi:hypothetical protein